MQRGMDSELHQLLAVVLERIVGKAGEARKDAGPRFRPAFERNRVEVGNRPLAPTSRRGGHDTPVEAAEVAQYRQAARAPAEPGQQRCNGAGCVAVRGQRQHPTAGCEVKPQCVERVRMQADRSAIGKRPAELSGRQAEGTRLRQGLVSSLSG